MPKLPLHSFKTVDSYGLVPRDFHLVIDEAYRCSQQESDNLTLFKTRPENWQTHTSKGFHAPEVVCVVPSVGQLTVSLS